MNQWLARCLSIMLGVLICSSAMASEDKISVFVSVAPQKYIAQQIGKHLVDIHIMVHPGASPATYEPKPRQMVALAKTVLYFSIGVPFEKIWLDKIAAANPRMKVVATDQGIEKLPMATGHHHGHDEPVDEHDTSRERPLDPHIWTSPPLVLQQARTVLGALQQIDPIHGNEYAANFDRLAKELKALDEELSQIFKDLQGTRFMVFHPSWGYFAQTYGLQQVPIEIEGKAPKPSQLKQVIEFARQEKIKAIFVQPQFSAKSANLIAKAIGAKVIAADPLAMDWAGNLRRQAAEFKAALR